MPSEIERKFIVSSTTPALGDGTLLRQGYLAEDGDVQVRVRAAGGSATLTIKVGRGLSRCEIERDLSTAEFDELWPATSGRRVQKVRHRVDLGPGHGRLVAEVDVYADELDGLRLVEVEFPDVATAEAFLPPDWFGVEVTGDPRWSNASLARHGRPT